MPRLEFARATPGNNKRQGTVLTFLTDTTWVAPAGARILQRVAGKGSDGKPATGSHNYVDAFNTYQQNVTYIKAEDRWLYGSVNFYVVTEGSPVPGGFRNKNDENANFIFYIDFSFAYTQMDKGNYVDATTGGAATGFGQVFAGGPSAQPAPVSTFLNVQIVAGTSYPIVVPPGGYITIEN